MVKATISAHWDIHYRHSTGPTTAAFLTALRDDGVILGSRCNGCGRVLVPARGYCERCFRDTDALVPVGPKGTVEAFTTGATTLALILLDGASWSIPHLLGGVENDPERLLARVAEGLYVEAVLRPPDERTGSILDIECFRPVPGGH